MQSTRAPLPAKRKTVKPSNEVGAVLAIPARVRIRPGAAATVIAMQHAGGFKATHVSAQPCSAPVSASHAPPTEDPAPSLQERMRSAQWWTRYVALSEAAANPTALRASLPEVRKLLTDTHWQVRAGAIVTISSDDELIRDCGHALADLLADERPEVRAKAAMAIGQDDAILGKYEGHVARLLRDGDSFVRTAARHSTQHRELDEALRRRLLNGIVPIVPIPWT